MKNKILPLCYCLCFLLFLISGVFHFAYDRFTMGEQVSIPISEFQIYDMKKIDENQFVAVTNDPQFILLDGEKYDIRTIKYTMIKGGKGSKSVYYNNDSSQPFSEKKCIYAPFYSGDTIQYILPREKIAQIRLDISSVFAEHIQIEDVVVNYKPSFFEYFDIRAMDIAKFLGLPLIASAVLRYLFDIFEFYKDKFAQNR